MHYFLIVDHLWPTYLCPCIFLVTIDSSQPDIDLASAFFISPWNVCCFGLLLELSAILGSCLFSNSLLCNAL